LKITFHGATHTVTGSMHQVDIGGKTYLLDCGMFQGRRELARRLNSTFAFDPKSVAGVILSHAHTDHCGKLPVLVKQGFRGPIYTTRASATITTLMLLDSAKIQEEDAGYLNQKTTKSWQGPIAPPLYTHEDVAETIKLFSFVEYRRPTDLGGWTLEFRDAGHALGSSAMQIKADGKTLVFTGDVGRPHSPIVREPDPFDYADALISECTYGGRVHTPIEEVPGQFAAIVNETVKAGGLVIMPAFALGRTQAVVEILHQLREAKKIPGWLPVYVDAPLATRITAVFRDFDHLMDDETRNMIQPFDFQNLVYVGSSQDSQKLNNLRSPAVIIAGSGMCESGRVLHHLKHHIRQPQNTVLLPGFQAENTLGRKIQEKWREVPILGDLVPLNCRVERMEGLSAHADGRELLAYCSPLKRAGLRTYLVHGEDDAAQAHKKALEAAGFSEVTVASRGQSVDV
jgi:metallo-beta-lactamase family protein